MSESTDSPTVCAIHTKVPERPTPIAVAVARLLQLIDFDQRVITCAVMQKIREDRPDYWLKRADELEASAPRLGQFHGQKTRAELAEDWHRCMVAASACRGYAALLSGEFQDGLDGGVA